MILPSFRLSISKEIFELHLMNFVRDYEIEPNHRIEVRRKKISSLVTRYEFLLSTEENEGDSADELFGELKWIPIDEKKSQIELAVLRLDEFPLGGEFFDRFYADIRNKWNPKLILDRYDREVIGNDPFLEKQPLLFTRWKLLYKLDIDPKYVIPRLSIEGLPSKDPVLPDSPEVEKKLQELAEEMKRGLPRIQEIAENEVLRKVTKGSKFDDIPDPDEEKKYGTDRNLTKNDIRGHVALCRQYQDNNGTVKGYYDSLGSSPPFTLETLRSYLKDPRFAPNSIEEKG